MEIHISKSVDIKYALLATIVKKKTFLIPNASIIHK